MRASPKTPGAAPAPVLRRAYFDCRFGQLHVHQAIPPGGGFDERTSLLCLPGPGVTAALFQPLLAELGADRSVFALDPPGAGQSDAAAGVEPQPAAALAAATLDFLQNMRIRRAHVLADGAAVPALALLLPQVAGRITRVVVCGAPVDALPGGTTLIRTLPVTAGELSAGNEAARAALRQLREFLDAEPR